MITITKRPERYHKLYTDKLSRWQCSRHPFLFEFTRRDITIIQVNDIGGLTELVVAPYDSASANEVEVGTQLYFSGYGRAITVTAITQSGTPNFAFMTDAPIVANILNGFANILSRKNYYVEVKFFGQTPITRAVDVDFGSVRITPDKYGIARLDVQAFLNGYVSKDNLSTYDAQVFFDVAPFGFLTIKYAERWREYSPDLIDDQRLYGFIDATKKLLDDYGQNLCDHLLFDLDPLNYPSIIDQRAKFLCDFVSPTYFVGFPFSLSYILTAEGNRGLSIIEDWFANSGASTGGGNLLISDQYISDGVYRLSLLDQLSGAPYVGTDRVELYLEIGNVYQDRYWVDGYTVDEYTVNVPPSSTAYNEQRATEIKTIKIVQPCSDGVVFLCWRNSKGGWSYWLFENKSEIEILSSQEASYQSEGDDLEVASRRTTYLQANQKKTISLGGVVDADDFEGIKTIYQSPNVLMLVDQTKLATETSRAWLAVRPIPKSLKHFSNAEKIEFEIEIEMPSLYTIQN
jgi:hypothetical protein